MKLPEPMAPCKKPEAPAILILAAGASRRMGRPKQLLPWKNQPLIRYVAGQALALPKRPVLVITGAYSDLVCHALQDMPVELAHCADWASGMGHSLAFGIARLEVLCPEVSGVMVLLSDQPLVEAGYLERLGVQFEKQGAKGIVASSYAQTLGPPLVFSRDFFPELKALRGDRGARMLLERFATEVHPIPFPEGALDWDTPEDLEHSGISY